MKKFHALKALYFRMNALISASGKNLKRKNFSTGFLIKGYVPLNFIQSYLTKFSKIFTSQKCLYIQDGNDRCFMNIKNIKGVLSLKDYFTLEHLTKVRMSVII